MADKFRATYTPGDTGWINLTLALGSPYGAGFQAPRCRKISDLVYVQGLIGGLAGGLSSGAVVANLSVGFRPVGGQLIFASSGSGGFCRIDIGTNGDIAVLTAIAPGGFVSITVPPFPAD